MLVLATLGFFGGLRYLPLAEASAITFLAPIFVVALSWPLLRERATHARRIASIAGFVGILILLRPGSAVMHPAVVLLVGAALANALYQLLTRKLLDESPHTTLFYSASVGTVVLSLALPFAIDAAQIPEVRAAAVPADGPARGPGPLVPDARVSARAGVAADAVHVPADRVGDCIRIRDLRPAPRSAYRRSAWRSSSRAASRSRCGNSGGCDCSESSDRRNARARRAMRRRRDGPVLYNAGLVNHLQNKSAEPYVHHVQIAKAGATMIKRSMFTALSAIALAATLAACGQQSQQAADKAKESASKAADSAATAAKDAATAASAAAKDATNAAAEAAKNAADATKDAAGKAADAAKDASTQAGTATKDAANQAADASKDAAAKADEAAMKANAAAKEAAKDAKK